MCEIIEETLEKEIKQLSEDVKKVFSYYESMKKKHGENSFSAGKALGRARGLENTIKILKNVLEQHRVVDAEGNPI